MNSEELIRKGYRMVSRNFRIAASLDGKSDTAIRWFFLFGEGVSPGWKPGEKMSGVALGSIASQREHYRRVWSSDRIEVSCAVAMEMTGFEH